MKTAKKNDDVARTDLFTRRNVLAGTGAAMAAVSVSSPAGASSHKMDHSGHGMKKYQAATDAAFHCVKMGEACIEHCLILFKNSDTSVADCARVAQEMTAMCQTLARFAAFESPHLAKLAKVCIDVCMACEKECRKHANKHQDCKNCADSCVACIAECKKIAA
ncbi:MAG: four-helix bundle copper-binding protein [Rhodospirillaceae bacterium]|nr:four-helix bundle copper-binding protein [Rhodospirillaceae bacterium]MBT5878378.1 four-helix bundle copper-binding protein [Rhodospirillaceae bacterium]